MKLEVKSTEEDYLEYQLFAVSQSEVIQKKMRNSRWLISGFFLIAAIFNYLDGENIFLTIYFAVFSLVIFVFYPKYAKWLYKRSLRKQIQQAYSNKFGKTAEIEFEGQYVFTKDFTGEGKYYLSDFDSVVETNNYFFLKLNSGAAIIIPKRDVANITELKAQLTSFGLALDDFTDWKW